MPFYEYECRNCKFYTELMQKISDPPLEKCPSCGKKTLQKLISAPVFRLKGGGWYETDFKGDNENRRNLAGADKEESKSESDSSGKAADGKADAKPAAAEAKAAPAPAAEPKRSSSSARPAAAKSQGKSKAAARTASRPASKAKSGAKGKAKKGRR